MALPFTDVGSPNDALGSAMPNVQVPGAKVAAVHDAPEAHVPDAPQSSQADESSTSGSAARDAAAARAAADKRVAVEEWRERKAAADTAKEQAEAEAKASAAAEAERARRAAARAKQVSFDDYVLHRFFCVAWVHVVFEACITERCSQPLIWVLQEAVALYRLEKEQREMRERQVKEVLLQGGSGGAKYNAAEMRARRAADLEAARVRREKLEKRHAPPARAQPPSSFSASTGGGAPRDPTRVL